MKDILERLRGTECDKDNFPRMTKERWLSVGLALEAADEIERLRAQNINFRVSIGQMQDEAVALRAEIKRLHSNDIPAKLHTVIVPPENQ